MQSPCRQCAHELTDKSLCIDQCARLDAWQKGEPMPAETPAVKKAREVESSTVKENLTVAPPPAPELPLVEFTKIENGTFLNPDPPPRCPKHPQEPQKQDKRGYFMGMCLICLQDRCKARAKQNKPPELSEPGAPQSGRSDKNVQVVQEQEQAELYTFTLTFPPHLQPLYNWLIDTAAAEFRTPEMQALYLLHLAHPT